MLRSIKEMKGYAIKAKDGDIGKVEDFYFDDERWVVRYMVTDIGSWMQGKSVLVSTSAFFGQADWDKREFPVSLTREMVGKCPDIDLHKPVFRQKEEELSAYYKWPVYWQVAEATGGITPSMPFIGPPNEPTQSKDKGDLHLRSFAKVAGYNIRAGDGDIGHVEDLIVDDKRWNIAYMVVNTNAWMPNKKVIVALNWIKNISWERSEVAVDLTREQIKGSPLYDPSNGVNRDFEDKLYDYYGRPKYWTPAA
jgi:uncharacterized protein YrrD